MRKLALVLALVLAACGGDATAPRSDLAGTYTLASVNGGALPAFAWQDNLGRWEIVGGSLELTDRTYLQTVDWRIAAPWGSSTQTTGGQGTYSASGGSVRFEGGPTSGTVAGGAISLVVDGRTLVYRR